MRNLLILLMLVISSSVHASWNLHSAMFAEASRVTEVDIRDLAAMAALESSFQADVKADTSSATGLFQFTKRTWAVTLGNYGGLYDLEPDVAVTDPWANTLMGAEYMKENRRVLFRKLDRDPTLVDVYMAHFIAPRRVAALEDINPNVAIALLYPNLAKHNKAVFFTGDRSRTVAEFRAFITEKVNRAYNMYDELAITAFNTMMVEYFVKFIDSKESYWLCAKNVNVRTWGADFLEVVMSKVPLLGITKLPMTVNAYKAPGGGPASHEYLVAVPLTDRRWIM